MDSALAKLLAQVSEFVYRKSFGTDDTSGFGGLSIIPIVDGGKQPTSFAGVVGFEDKTVLAFQGTIPRLGPGFIEDWRENFRADQVVREDLGLRGKVHSGFADQLSLIQHKILESLEGNTLPLYVTGHSQGGAIAVLATKWLESRNIPVEATYTFAAARAGDQAFADAITTPVFRIEFGNDVVPHVPFAKTSIPLVRSLLQNPIFELASESDLVATVEENFVSVGPLTYRQLPFGLEMDMSPEREAEVRVDRENRLMAAGPTLLTDHLPSNYVAMFDPGFLGAVIENLPDLFKAFEP